MLRMISQQMLLMVTRNMFPCTETSSQAFGGKGRVRAQVIPEGSCYTREHNRFMNKSTEKIFHTGCGLVKHTLAFLQLINAAV